MRAQPDTTGAQFRFEPGEERMRQDDAFKPLHDQSSSGDVDVARIAAASTVMSMPTGHQVMQRPQPTQPEVPNWSIQLASLWVIH